MLLTVQPIGSVVVAAIIFRESPSDLQLAGAALVLAALIVAGRPRPPGRAVAQSGSEPGTRVPAPAAEMVEV